MNWTINWKQKLSSRKFWACVAGWVTSLLTAFHVTESVIAQVTLIVVNMSLTLNTRAAEG
jgi:hypothetical protein